MGATLRVVAAASFTLVLFAGAAGLGAAKAHAQGAGDVAGTVAAVEGTAEIARGATAGTAFEPIVAGTEVRVGDRIRTGRPGRVRIAFVDDTTLNVADASDVVIDDHVFAPDQGSVSSAIRLLGGKIRALVSEYYVDPTASYEVETATAVSGVRGTDFIVVYDDDDELTQVVDITGRVAVRGADAPEGSGVLLTPGTMTTVARDGQPTEPRAVSAGELTEFLEGTELIGGGEAESMVLDSPLLDDGALPAEDSAGGAGTAEPGAEPGAEPAAEAVEPGAEPEAETEAGGAGEPTEVFESPNTEQPYIPGEGASPADVVEQPPDVIESVGEIDVEFLRGTAGTARK
jgi:hypothetical protein